MLLARSRRPLVGAALALLWLHVVLVPSLTVAAPVAIPNGTPVDLTFPTAVNPTTAVIGQTIVLNAVNDVTVNGTVVIAQGAPAQAEIVRAERQGSIGKPAEISVILRSVAAVDGASIPLTGQKSVIGESKQTSALVITLLCCVLGLLQKGGSAEIPAGSTVRGSVVGPVNVEA